MPFNSGPACILGDCPAPSFPVTDAACNCDFVVGGINEFYAIPCTETMSEANVVDTAWWQAMITAETLGRSGKGVGSIAQGNTATARISSCEPDGIISITWNFTFRVACWDKTSARTTSKKFTELLTKGAKYLIIARMCDGDETVLPIGRATVTAIDFVVPETNDELQTLQVVLSWKELAVPETIDVPGLAVILPKAA
jgi:hypothetical protein